MENLVNKFRLYAGYKKNGWKQVLVLNPAAFLDSSWGFWAKNDCLGAITFAGIIDYQMGGPHVTDIINV